MKKLILSAAMLCVMSLSQAESLKVTSGVFEMNEQTLTFNGKKVAVSEDAMSFHVEGNYKVKDTEVVLFFQPTGGNGCPGTYFFVTVDKTGAKKSAMFGTCSDLVKVKQSANNLIVTMPNMNGKGLSKYIYDGGLVTENGKLLK